MSIKKDVDNKPIPQYYNALQNAYEVLQGRNGANRVEIYDANGDPIDIEALINDIITILNEKNLPIGASTEEKQTEIITKLTEILSNIPTDTSTSTKQDEIIDKLGPKTHYLLSTDAKPTTAEKGETVFEIDTQTVYMYNGTGWVVI